jgi:hypothetical protein
MGIPMTPVFRRTQNALLVETYKICAKYTLSYGEVLGNMVENETFTDWATRVQFILKIAVPLKEVAHLGVKDA